MCQIDYRPKGFQAVAVALANNEIHLYRDKFLVDTITVDKTIYAMKFGRLGRDDATLILIAKGRTTDRLERIYSSKLFRRRIDH